MVSHRNSFEEVTRTYSTGTRFLHKNIFLQIWLDSDSYRVIMHTNASETKPSFLLRNIHFKETKKTRIQRPYC